MKKLIVPVLLALVCSCTKVETGSPDEALLSGTKHLNKTKYAGDGLWDLLGYGYDVTGEFANSSASKLKVVDAVAMKQGEPNRVEQSGSETGHAFVAAGADASSAGIDMWSKVSSSLSIPLFNAQLASFYANGTLTTNSSEKYIYSYCSYNIIKRRVWMMNILSIMKQYRTAEFLSDVQNMPASQLVYWYGTHVLTDIKLGAKLEAVYRAESTSSNKKLSAETGGVLGIEKLFKIDMKYSVTSTSSQSNTFQTLSYRTVGGNAAGVTPGTILLDPNNPASVNWNFSTWQSGITDANAELVEISQDGLIPIYDLIDDPAKRTEVMDYVNLYLASHHTTVTPYTAEYLPAAWESRAIPLTNITSMMDGYILGGIAPLLVSEDVNNNAIYSPSRTYKLVMQTDGNLVIYKVYGNQPLWSTQTSNSDMSWKYKLYYQSDGNLIIKRYKAGVTEHDIWASYTEAPINTARAVNAYRAYWVMQDDGNFAMYYNGPSYQYSLEYSSRTNGGVWSPRQGRLK